MSGQAATGEARAVWALSVAMLLNYAGAYYAFPALLPDRLATSGWSEAELALGPSLSFLATAVLTPLTGRLVDRGWGWVLLIGAPVLAALCLVGQGWTGSHPVYLACWLVIGVTQAAMFYETAFAILTRRIEHGARAAITRVTLVAGFSGTFTFPFAHAVSGAFGPEAGWLAFAALMVFGSVPLSIYAMQHLGAGRRLPQASGTGPDHPVAQAIRRWPFWALSGLFGLVGLNQAVVLTFILLLFADVGASPGMATAAAAMIGPSQVVGRLLLMGFEARLGNGPAILLSVLACFGSTILLWLGWWDTRAIFAFAVAHGMGMGTLSILRPVVIAQTLGRQGFGAVSGAIAVAPGLATAIGPALGAGLMVWGGTSAIMAAAVAMTAAGAGFGIWLAIGALGAGRQG